jgi:hypothetical protein
MKPRTLLIVGFWALVTYGAWAQDTKIVEYAKVFSRAFTQDGLTIETGIGADGVQNLTVLANGGYFPLQVTAKAGVASVLRVYTDKTYDCSRAFLLPDFKKQVVLPVKGVTVFPIAPQKKGSALFGTCGMGMYTFEIRFE